MNRDLNRYPPLNVEVQTGPKDADSPTKSKTIDWRNPSDRKWLTSHQHWAVMNNHVVALIPSV